MVEKCVIQGYFVECTFNIQEKELVILEKLALSDEILLSIDKPARYIGNEMNSVIMD